MPKQTVETFVGVKFDVAEGTVNVQGDEQEVRILVINDGPHSMRFPIAKESAMELADLLRGDGIVTAPTVLHVPGTKR